MKRIFFLLSVLLIRTYANAMEAVSLLSEQKLYKIKTYEDIPFMPLKSIHRGLVLLSQKEQEIIEQKTSKSSCASLLFNVAKLPSDLRLLILKKVVDGDHQIAQTLHNIPIIHALRICQEVQQCLPLMLGEGEDAREYSMGELLRLPYEQRMNLVSIAKPSLVERMFGYNNARISGVAYKALQKLPLNMRQGVTLKQLNLTQVKSKIYCSLFFSTFFFISSVSCGILYAATNGTRSLLTGSIICGMGSGIFLFAGLVQCIGNRFYIENRTKPVQLEALDIDNIHDDGVIQVSVIEDETRIQISDDEENDYLIT